ncbi:MAG: DUF6428 family protein [Bacteroidota bacterium]
MKFFDVLTALESLTEVKFVLPDGSEVPPHFHVTEVGQLDKKFIDCGGTLRTESTINFQLFTAEDYDHRLSCEKLKRIIELSIDKLSLGNHEVEVEFQSETISVYDLAFANGEFRLLAKQTDCLAKDKCGIPSHKPKIRLSALSAKDQTTCGPGSGCC